MQIKRIARIAILAQFDNDKVHQILISQEQEQAVLNLIMATDKNKTLNVIDTALEGIEIQTNDKPNKSTKS